MSNEYPWDVARPEQTRELVSRWDVRRAKIILVQRPRRIEVISLDRYRNFFERMLEEALIREDTIWHAVDPELPAIFGTEDGKKLLLDGRQRLRKALNGGMDQLPIVTLTDGSRNE